MTKVAMILRRSPYGDINAAEAVRHAMGGATNELGVDLVLVDSGVFIAKSGQDDTNTGFTNLESALKDCIDLGVNVYADKSSIREQHIETKDIIEGVKVVNAVEISELVKDADQTMIF